jgi:L-alanine-DL-glutamate epimerase-like enolase superfamily enzyme
MAQIDRVEVHQFAHPVRHLGRDHAGNFVCCPGANAALDGFAVRVHADDGVVGEFVPVFGGKKAYLGQVLTLAPTLLGMDGDRRERLYSDGKRVLRHSGAIGVSALDCALWDLAGRRLGTSISRLLGGHRTRLPAYASTLHADRNGGLPSKEAFGDFALHCRELGFRAFKVHGWSDGNAREEAENLLHLRKVVGDEMALMIDPACELRTFADALYVGRACDEVGALWYEDPFRDGGWSQHAHRKLRELIRTPLLITEHVRGLEPKADFITAHATDFVRADPNLDLGITGSMKIAHLAEAFGLDCELHGPGPAHRACMSAMRNSNYYELGLVAPMVGNAAPPVYRCDYSEALEAVGADGCYPVPDGPGLGVQYDWEFIARHTSQVHRFA